MLENNSTYTLSTALDVLDQEMTNKFCRDCHNCPFALEKKIDIYINGHKYKIWCYGILLTDIRFELNSVF